MWFATAASLTFNFNKMKKLSREEMKRVMGGALTETVKKYHCYGTQSNCSNSKPGPCTFGELNCNTYCSKDGGPTYWC